MTDSATVDRDGIELHAIVDDRLRCTGRRYTAGRRAMVDLLIATSHPVSIGDIADAVPSLPRSSAYRHLADLEAASVIRRVVAGDEFTRFELVEELTEHHHHLLCTTCGTVIDVASTAPFETTVTQHLDRVARAEGFEPHGHRIDVFGVCAACR